MRRLMALVDSFGWDKPSGTRDFAPVLRSFPQVHRERDKHLFFSMAAPFRSPIFRALSWRSDARLIANCSSATTFVTFPALQTSTQPSSESGWPDAHRTTLRHVRGGRDLSRAT